MKSDLTVNIAQALEFAEWLESKFVRCGKHKWSLGAGDGLKRYTTQEAFEMYLTNIISKALYKDLGIIKPDNCESGGFVPTGKSKEMDFVFTEESLQKHKNNLEF